MTIEPAINSMTSEFYPAPRPAVSRWLQTIGGGRLFQPTA